MAESGLSRRQVLEWHMTYNHYPAISLDFVEAAETALDSVKNNNPERMITMPNGLRKRAAEIVEGMRLEDFLQLNA